MYLRRSRRQLLKEPIAIEIDVDTAEDGPSEVVREKRCYWKIAQKNIAVLAVLVVVVDAEDGPCRDAGIHIRRPVERVKHLGYSLEIYNSGRGGVSFLYLPIFLSNIVNHLRCYCNFLKTSAK